MGQEMKKKAVSLEPVVRIGKNGLTAGIIQEIKLHLKKKKIIKIRFLRTALGKKSKDTLRKIAEQTAEKTSSMVIQIIGLNIVLATKKSQSKSNEL